MYCQGYIGIGFIYIAHEFCGYVCHMVNISSFTVEITYISRAMWIINIPMGELDWLSLRQCAHPPCRRRQKFSDSVTKRYCNGKAEHLWAAGEMVFFRCLTSLDVESRFEKPLNIEMSWNPFWAFPFCRLTMRKYALTWNASNHCRRMRNMHSVY